MSEPQPVRQFFAITQNSVYRVTYDGNGGWADRVAPDRLSESVGHLERKPFVDISLDGIALYYDDAQPIVQEGRSRPRSVDEVLPEHRGGHTSRLCALCLRETDVLALKKGGEGAPDPIALTKEVVQVIGDSHPFYVVRRSGEGAFSEEYFQ